tara:strand:- start:21 stop:1184 length:1164 start_codon:yes stop_codon:yes gene_type:complete
MTAYLPKILERILENTNTTTNKGIIIASPSTVPPYKFHWIRDSALVMRVFIDMYTRTKESKYFEYIINYIENESKVQDLPTLSGLGEPKINIDCTPFNGDWGRPQNDGPALRGIMMVKIINIFKYNYDVLINQLIRPIIIKDIKYIIENYDKISFDLWEEKKGWHFYTRMVQLKFLKDIISINKYLKLERKLMSTITEVVKHLYHSLDDHISENDKGKYIISSFDQSGKIIKYEDSANLLAYCHIDYDTEIIEKFPLEYVLHTSNNLLTYFSKKYNDQENICIGRYIDDKYYNGHAWIICTISLAQVYIELYKKRNKQIKRQSMDRAVSNPNNDLFIVANDILEKVLTIDCDFLLPEQFNPIDCEHFSAKKLTWNYSELYFLIRNLH